VAQGFAAIAAAEPDRVRRIDATQPIPAVHEAVWNCVAPLLVNG